MSDVSTKRCKSEVSQIRYVLLQVGNLLSHLRVTTPFVQLHAVRRAKLPDTEFLAEGTKTLYYPHMIAAKKKMP